MIKVQLRPEIREQINIKLAALNMTGPLIQRKYNIGYSTLYQLRTLTPQRPNISARSRAFIQQIFPEKTFDELFIIEQQDS